jgi:3-dehydroquinate synthase
VGDLAGFAAATYLRGIPFIQVPTTLLAQVDSSIGGKTAVNHPRGKNLIGAFYQPRMVLIDVDTLATLPPRDLRSGLGEIVKYGVIASPTLFERLEARASDVLASETTLLTGIIEECCQIKADVVSADEHEGGIRAILNFGHTFGHAIEAATGFSTYTHGEAVAIGMVWATELSRRMGVCGSDLPGRIQALLHALELPTRLNGPVTGLREAMRLDKKAIGGRLRFILVEALGKVSLRDDVPADLVEDIVAWGVAAQPLPVEVTTRAV